MNDATDPTAGGTLAEGPWEVARRGAAGIELDREAFLAALAARSALDGTSLGAGEAVDLYLVAACEGGEDGAWEALAQRHFAALSARLRARGASASDAAEVLDELPGHLCEPPPSGGARTRLGTWDGSGRLVAWLTVVALRRWWQRLRERGRDAPHTRTPVDGKATPLTTCVGRERATRFESALHDAWGHLTPRECLAVLLRYRDGLPQVRIAEVMGVGEPRVSRLVTGGVAKLRDAVRRQLGDGEGESPSSWGALREAASDSMATSGGSSHSPGEEHGDDTTPG